VKKGKAEGKKVTTQPRPAVQVLKLGKRRIVGGTKFGQDGCGY